MPDSNPTRATSKLADAVSLWRINPSNTNEVVDAAVECLLADVDSPKLRELAGASPRESHFVLEPLIEDTLQELGMQEVLSTNVQRGALTVMLRRLMDDRISSRELVRWAHSQIGHDGDADCQVFVDLDDMYDTADYYDEFGPEDLDRWTIQEAEAFLEGRPSPAHTRIWQTPSKATALICGPRRWRRRFTVRVAPGGREFWASSWDDLFGSLPEMGVPWRNVLFESEEVRGQVLKAWGPHPDAPAT